MADLKCGQGGSNGLEIIGRINHLSRLDPRGSLRLATPVSVQVSDDAVPVKIDDAFDTQVTSRGGLSVDIAEATITNNSGFDFTSAILTVGLNVMFPSSETLELYVYINDAEYSNQPIVITGDGSGDPREAFWQSELEVKQGDVIDVRCRNRNTGDYTMQVIRSTLRLDAEWNETL